MIKICASFRSEGGWLGWGPLCRLRRRIGVLGWTTGQRRSIAIYLVRVWEALPLMPSGLEKVSAAGRNAILYYSTRHRCAGALTDTGLLECLGEGKTFLGLLESCGVWGGVEQKVLRHKWKGGVLPPISLPANPPTHRPLMVPHYTQMDSLLLQPLEASTDPLMAPLCSLNFKPPSSTPPPRWPEAVHTLGNILPLH